MLNISTSQTPSKHVQLRAQGLRARKYDAGKNTISFRVGPIGGRFEDLVLFDVKRGVAECSRLKDGSRCERNKFGGMCAHVWCAAQELDAESKRRAA
jgi:hypothetical protein